MNSMAAVMYAGAEMVVSDSAMRTAASALLFVIHFWRSARLVMPSIERRVAPLFAAINWGSRVVNQVAKIVDDIIGIVVVKIP